MVQLLKVVKGIKLLKMPPPPPGDITCEGYLTG